MNIDTTRTVLSAPDQLLDGRYRLVEQIGRGGAGEVFRARDTRLERDVAVKVLGDPAPRDAAHFATEARTLARFSHPHLVRVLDAGQVAGAAYLVMDLVEGSTLAHQLQQGPLDSGEVSRIGGGVASALAYVHGKGVIHRDVKPANILVSGDGWVWLADFGIARLVNTAGSTAAGIVHGTPAFLAPEQVEGSEVGPPADIYALGLVLLEGLTGRRAFEGTPAELMLARLHRSAEVPDHLDAGWRVLLRSMISRVPAERPSAAEVGAFLTGQSTLALDTAVLGDTGRFGGTAPGGTPEPFETPASPETSAPPAPPSSTRRRRGRKLALALVLLVVLAAGVTLGAFLFAGTASPPAVVAPQPLHVTGGSAAKPASPAPTPTTAAPTTLPTTTTIPPATATTRPTTSTSAVSPVAAASDALVSLIDSDVRDGTMDAQSGQQLMSQLDHVLNPSGRRTHQQLSRQFHALVRTFDLLAQRGQTGDAATTRDLRSAIDNLASALGVTVTRRHGSSGQTLGGGGPF